MPVKDTQSACDDSLVKPVQCTLIIPFDPTTNSILLAKKARGFGIGKWMGFGGKVEFGETIDAGALRELQEETGVALGQDQIIKIGLLLFSFESGYFLEVHVYTSPHIEIETLCDEFEGRGAWFSREELPLKQMWPDFSYWCGQVFQRKRFRARFWYGDYDTVLKSSITPVEPEDTQIMAAEDWFLSVDCL